MSQPCHPRGSEFLRMVMIPEGRFVMGGMGNDKFVTGVELPAREVKVEREFGISETPVTRKQWMRVMGRLPSGSPELDEDDLPVVCISYADAWVFCRELGAGCRLPSEAEWEYACRAGSGTVFPNGSNVSTEEANYLYDERGSEVGKGRLTPVGSYGRNGFGLSDMVGNVCEWVADSWHAGYAGAPENAEAWVSGGKQGCRVIRGGGWDHLPRVLRASWRDWAPEDARWDNLGFRVVKDL